MILFLSLLMVITTEVSEAAQLFLPLLKLVPKKVFSNINIVKDVIKKKGLTVSSGGLLFYTGVEEISTADFCLPTKYAYIQKRIRSAWASMERTKQNIQTAKNGLSTNYNCLVALLTILVVVLAWTCHALKTVIYIRPLK